MSYKSFIADFFRAVIAKLTRPGVNVGGTAAYPRTEVHSVVEDAPLTKDGTLRHITCTVEVITDTKVADAVEIMQENAVRLFTEKGLAVPGATLVGLVPGQVRLFEEQETSDSARVLYRILQDMECWIENS